MPSVRERIRKLSGRTELLWVLFVAFGAMVPESLAALFAPASLAHRDSPPITNTAVLGTILYELVIFAILVPFLRARGWTLARLGISPSVRSSFIGLGLFVVCTLAYYLLALSLAGLWPAFAQVAMSTHLVASGLNGPTVLVGSLVNPLFEEVFVCGYVISALKDKRGVTTAVNVSAGIRVFYHFYQGALGIVAIAPMGLLFAYWYARTGRLWPLLVAHALNDFLALMFGGG
jgi:uncharacterized protein